MLIIMRLHQCTSDNVTSSAYGAMPRMPCCSCHSMYSCHQSFFVHLARLHAAAIRECRRAHSGSLPAQRWICSQHACGPLTSSLTPRSTYPRAFAGMPSLIDDTLLCCRPRRLRSRGGALRRSRLQRTCGACELSWTPRSTPARMASWCTSARGTRARTSMSSLCGALPPIRNSSAHGHASSRWAAMSWQCSVCLAMQAPFLLSQPLYVFITPVNPPCIPHP